MGIALDPRMRHASNRQSTSSACHSRGGGGGIFLFESGDFCPLMVFFFSFSFFPLVLVFMSLCEKMVLHIQRSTAEAAKKETPRGNLMRYNHGVLLVHVAFSFFLFFSVLLIS
jgi:hypothetical protein